MIPDKLLERKNQEFTILLDAESFGSKSGKSDEDVKRITIFSDSDYFKMMRIPCNVTYEGLGQITTYEVTSNKSDQADYTSGIWPPGFHSF